MRKNQCFLSISLALVVAFLSAKPVQAANDGQIGFIVDDQISSFLSYGGEVIFDLFAPLNGGDLVNSSASSLKGLGVYQDFPQSFGEDFIGLVQFLSGYTAADTLGTETFDFVYSPDPFIAYNAKFVNETAAPVEIVFDQTYPIIPVAGATEVISQINIDLVDADGDGSASVTLNSFDDSIQKVTLLEGGIFGSGSDSGLIAGADVTSAGETRFGEDTTAGPAPAVAWDYLAVSGRFILSPGDEVTITGVGGVVEAGGFLPSLDNLSFDNFAALFDGSPAGDADYNNDGTVDASDYTVWLDNLGSTVLLPGDTTPGLVSQADYDVWKANFGSIAGSGVVFTVVPEPSSIVLAAPVLLIGAMRRRYA